MAISAAATAESRPVPRDRPAVLMAAELPARQPAARPAEAPLPRARSAKPEAAITGSLATDDRAARHERQAGCLAKAIYFEARGETLEGQFAVARVVLNRVADPRFPDTICEVVYQHSELTNRCQFSFACDGLPDEPDDPTAWAMARGMAEALTRVERPQLSRRVLRATHYHADYVSPWWAAKLRMAGQVGRHIFYHEARGQAQHASAGEAGIR